MNQTIINDIQRHLSRGEQLDRAGDSRSASGFYSAALKLAQSIPGQVPQQFMPALLSAQEKLKNYAAAYEDYIRKAMPESQSTPRIAQALDIITGRAQIFHQQPNMLYFPELPQRQFYEREEFDWVPEFEAHTDIIRQEANAALASKGNFDPYLTSSDKQVVSGHHEMLDNPDWGAFYLYKDGVRQENNALLCPQTMSVLDALPLPFVDQRLPSVLFSALRPGAHIPPHHGYLNTRLICHLPLIVPGNGALRVGNQVREWEMGKTLIFDDSIEHEAWNKSDDIRIILLFEVWRPELSDEERQGVKRLLEAVDAYRA